MYTGSQDFHFGHRRHATFCVLFKGGKNTLPVSTVHPKIIKRRIAPPLHKTCGRGGGVGDRRLLIPGSTTHNCEGVVDYGAEHEKINGNTNVSGRRAFIPYVHEVFRGFKKVGSRMRTERVSFSFFLFEAFVSAFRVREKI